MYIKPVHSNRNSLVSNLTSDYRCYGECEDEEELESPSDAFNNTLRTQMFLLDYKQFKAARTIQKIIRGWLVRKLMKRQQYAATTIQRAWRMYSASHHLPILAQDMLQHSILIMYESSSIKIQAAFRGWWSRKHINNFVRLRRVQLDALEDILHYLAQKLHSCMRSGHVPGTNTYCTEECLVKVSRLVAAVSYRLYNYIVEQKFKFATSDLKRKQDDFKNSTLYTQVPFEGSDDNSHKQCNGPYKYYDQSQRIMAQQFVEGMRKVEHKGKKDKKRVKIQPNVLSQHQINFCEEMMQTIKHWSVFKESNLFDSNSSMDIHVSEFIDIVKGYLNSFHYTDSVTRNISILNHN